MDDLISCGNVTLSRSEVMMTEIMSVVFMFSWWFENRSSEFQHFSGFRVFIHLQAIQPSNLIPR